MKKSLSYILTGAILAFLALPTAFADDTENPGDVESLEATPYNQAVGLTWSEATDDTEVTGYKLHYGSASVGESGETYDFEKDVGNVLQYVVTGLENDSTYYFSVTAYDAAGNESLFWAPEAEATPTEDAGEPDPDADAPQVTEAEALNKEEVLIVFSEAVVLPEEDPHDAFTIENDETFEILAVYDAMPDAEDEDGKTVILTTAEQEKNVVYKITVGVDIEDQVGNPVISGTSDTALFVGTDEEKAVEDVDGPEVSGVELVDESHILVSFNETIVLSIDPSEDFYIENEDKEQLTVLGVELGVNDEGIEGASAMITTDTQSAGTYTLTVLNVTDEAGNDMNPDANTGTFEGMDLGGGEPDGEPEEEPSSAKDVANLIAKKVLEAEKYLVTLSWDVPAENDGVTEEQVLYKSTNKGSTYKEEAGLEPDTEEYEAGEFAPGEYWFKITQKDTEGNETTGTVVKVVLAQTGPGVAGLLLASLGLGRVVGRKRRK